jgi:uncharacterized membrane protein
MGNEKKVLTDEQTKALRYFGQQLLIFFYIFLVLRLTGLITWSGWWVTVPLWGLFALFIGIVLAALILILVYYFVKMLIYDPIKDKIQRKRREKIGLEYAD